MAASVSINYFSHDDGSSLGFERHEGITEVLLALPEANGHPVTITRFFEGQECHRWKIMQVEHPSAAQIDIHLTPRNECLDEVFLSQTYASNRSVASRIQKGTLVEVEYGYVQKTKRHTGIVGSNKRYPDGVQGSEMHKRRLAIVVSTKFPVLQVIPVTSIRQAEGNNAIFELSESSLAELTHYNDAHLRSFALAHMIQSVSIQRILPPLAWSGGPTKRRLQRSVGYPHKLTREDLKMLESAITSAVGYGDYQDVRDERNNLRQENRRLYEEISLQQGRLALLQVDADRVPALTRQREVMMEMLIDWRIQCYSETREIAIRAIEEEVEFLSAD